jgi:hypothetical protein
VTVEADEFGATFECVRRNPDIVGRYPEGVSLPELSIYLLARIYGFEKLIRLVLAPCSDQMIERASDAVVGVDSAEAGSLLQEPERCLVQRNAFAACQLTDFSLQAAIEASQRKLLTHD